MESVEVAFGRWKRKSASQATGVPFLRRREVFMYRYKDVNSQFDVNTTC